MPRKSPAAVAGLVAADILMVAAALALSFGLDQRFGLWPDSSPEPAALAVAFAALVTFVVMLFFAFERLYDLDTLFAGHREYAAVVKGSTSAVAVVIIIAFLAGEPVSRGALLLTWPLVALFVGGGRFAIRRLVFRLRETGRLVSKWLIVGADEHAAAVAAQLNAPRSKGIEVVGFLDDYLPVGGAVAEGLRVLGDPRGVRQVIDAHGVSTVVVVPHAISWESYRDLLELAAETNGFRIKLAPGLQHLVATGAQMTDSGFLPLVNLEPLRITGVNAVLKRAFDVAVSAPLLLLLALGATVCWLAARLDRAGPVVLRHQALGRQQRRFTLVVFARPEGPEPASLVGRCAWRLRRVIAASRFRKLPNILNVLAGHMSLVGPRSVSEADPALDRSCVRNLLLVRPGLTGPAADAARGEGIEAQTLKDIAYVRNYSLWLDIRLLFASFKRLLRRRNGLPAAYVPIGHGHGGLEAVGPPETVGRPT